MTPRASKEPRRLGYAVDRHTGNPHRIGIPEGDEMVAKVRLVDQAVGIAPGRSAD